MTDEDRGSQLFTEAMYTMENGSIERAEQLFIGSLNNLPPKHHLTILALKMLVTISSNKGAFEKAIDWSLKLLDAQTAALGYAHADTSRTVINIATMCETLGKHDLAKEVKELHKYASTAERTAKERSLKDLRDRDEIKEPKDTTQDEQHKNAIELIIAGIGEIRRMGEFVHPVIVALIFLFLMAIPFLVFTALKFTYSFAEQNARLARTNAQFISADKRLTFNYISAKQMSMIVDDKEFKLPFGAYGYTAMELGDLFICNPLDKQYWLMLTPDGLCDGQGRTFYHRNHPDVDTIKQVVNIATTCGLYHKRNKFYPDKIAEIGDFSYKNNYTLRRDYPIIQTVNVPGEANAEAFVNAMVTGVPWPGEAARYPGCINCAHISSKTNMSVPDTFLIHGCDGYGQLFTQSDGKPYIFALQKGGQLAPRQTPLTDIMNVSKICLLDIHPAWAGLVLSLISMRYVWYWGLMTVGFFFLAQFFHDEKTPKIALLFMALSFLLAVASFVLSRFLS